MAGETRRATERVASTEALEEQPGRFDFYAAMRRLECEFGNTGGMPAWGQALRPQDEPVRLGQDPEMRFEPRALTSFVPPASGRPGRLGVAFLGLFGPHGPLPSHLTEYARERSVHRGDDSFRAFADLFHHRMLLLFYRAWAAAQPVVGEGHRDNAFSNYLRAFLGLASPSLREKDAITDRAKLQFAGWLGGAIRNPEGLETVLSSYFDIPVRVEEFVGEWLEIPQENLTLLGVSEEVSTLGQTTILGRRVWSCNQKFRIVLGPMPRKVLERFLPAGDWTPQLNAMVSAYVTDELDWDVRLVPQERIAQQAQLTATQKLGQGLRLGRHLSPDNERDILVHPHSGSTSSVRQTTHHQSNMRA